MVQGLKANLKRSLLDVSVCGAGSEGQLEAAVRQHQRHAVPALQVPGEVQADALLPLLLPLHPAGEEEVPHAGLEHRLRVQRLRLRGQFMCVFWGIFSSASSSLGY